MMLIGVDYHPSFQQIAFFVEETGECRELQLNHSDGQAEKFYGDLQQRGIRVRVGMEAAGYSRWFERLLAATGMELWIDDPAQIKSKRVKKQKTDRRDALLLLRLMREDNFPQIWVPSPENRDLRQLLCKPARFTRQTAATDAVGQIVKQTSEQPPKYLVKLLFSFRGVSEVEVPADRIHGDK